ncbi:hypothetical protein HW555_002205 [Spodoptera exigua]|uniref:Uncharacterized protein n=1 Tax=Spodoptera exigua TaxID=7107 RepID=A0A835GMM9_SPOEX|nr:hypothetical protein HW555_002205 [Spodoptera exigua]
MAHSKMGRISYLVFSVCLLQAALAVKVKVVMHSDQEDSKMEEDEGGHTEPWDHKKRLDVTMMPFIKTRKHADDNKHVELDDEKPTTEKPKQQHPNEMIFPLIYRQSHVNSMFKFGENWYTWSTEKRTDGSKAINYYLCYDEPKRCDDIGWERTDALPKCAFQIDSLLPDDRACINSFGVEPRSGGICDGAEQMKVAEMVRACGPRIRSLWRFVRIGRRPVNAAKPADVNSLICEDEEECFITIEYRIHHDRITFSLHEPTRGQTFKSVLKREVAAEEEKVSPVTEVQPRVVHRSKKVTKAEEPVRSGNKKFRVNIKSKAEGKGVVKERNDSGAYANRRPAKNKIKVREDLSEDISE